MEDKDDIYLTIQIKRSDVEARFAETGKPASAFSMELIGDCLRKTRVEELKEIILTSFFAGLEMSARELLQEKGKHHGKREEDNLGTGAGSTARSGVDARRDEPEGA